MITAVVTCMGRRAFLERTLPWMLQGADRVVVVDYSCPERSGEWAWQRYGDSGKLVVKHVPNRARFNLSKARNAGVEASLAAGANGWLCFLDADTVAPPAFWLWLRQNVTPNLFYVVEGHWATRGLGGILVVEQAAFLASGGYDPEFRGWGHEDVDMRLRLALKMGMGFRTMPPTLVSSLPHSDALRTETQTDSKAASGERNARRMAANVRRWMRRHSHEVDAAVVARLVTGCGCGKGAGFGASVLFWKRVTGSRSSSVRRAWAARRCWW